MTSTQTGSVSSARIEALANELRQLKAVIDDVGSRIEKVLTEIDGALAGELSTTHAQSFDDDASPAQDAHQAAQSSDTNAHPAAPEQIIEPLTDAIEPINPCIDVAESRFGQPTPSAPSTSCNDQPIPPCSIDAPTDVASAVEIRAQAPEIVPTSESVPDLTVAADSLCGGATAPPDVPSNVIVLNEQRAAASSKRRPTHRRAVQWAAAVVLIAAAVAMMATSNGVAQRDAELQLAALNKASSSEPYRLPQSTMVEIWRLRARSAF